MTEAFYKEHYEEIDGVRIHYVDEGSGPPILMVHGQPTWSYLYRKMIPPLVDAGYRCVAPDLMVTAFMICSIFILRRGRPRKLRPIAVDRLINSYKMP